MKTEKLSYTAFGEPKEFEVHYLEDSEKRKEAVSFFQSHASSLFPEIFLPDEISKLPEEEANDFLKKNPMTRSWTGLTINEDDPIEDKDLDHLNQITEFEWIKIYSKKITDKGLRYLSSQKKITFLFIDAAITMDSFDVIRSLKTLEGLDIQSCDIESPPSLEDLKHDLPNLNDYYPPIK